MWAAVWLGSPGSEAITGFHRKHFLGHGIGLRAQHLLPWEVPRSFNPETWLLCLRVYPSTPVLYRGAGLYPEC